MDKNTASKEKSLLVVESPTKERSIAKFLGDSFYVASSYGHIRDLPKKKLGINVKLDFKQDFEVSPKGEKIIADLKKQLKKCKFLYLATDYDREGESIAWHLSELVDFDPKKTFRITFHEITKQAIVSAIKNPKKIDIALVQSQMARRILDRIVGYKISPLLWKILGPGLSAGRVQSVAVRIICDREKEITNFKKEEYWKLQIFLKDATGVKYEGTLHHWMGKKVQKMSIKNEASAKEIIKQLKIAKQYLIESIKKQKKQVFPSPPLITSTLSQRAAIILGFSTDKTMKVAQTLYEGISIDGETLGLITYMRTDSVNVAKSARTEARDWIRENIGKAYVPEKEKLYKTKSKSAQEAHEAIRPTSALRTPEDLKVHLSMDQYRLYRLIWKHFVASQMSNAIYEKITAAIHVFGDAMTQEKQTIIHVSDSQLIYDGFKKIFDLEEKKSNTKEQTQDVTALKKGENLFYSKIKPSQHFTEPPSRYSEASLIKALEVEEIGRPSTYATIIKTIVTRKYVEISQEKRFSPTELGILVNTQLEKFFPNIVDVKFTSEVEKYLDKIASNENNWIDVLKNFYATFQKNLNLAKEQMKKITILPKDSGCKCPIDNAKLMMHTSRYGKYVACENKESCSYKTNFENQKDIEFAIKKKCENCDKHMTLRIQKYSRFLSCTGYPDCKTTYTCTKSYQIIPKITPVITDILCQKCKSAMLLRGKLKYGKKSYFLACSAFPKCRNIEKPDDAIIQKYATDEEK